MNLINWTQNHTNLLLSQLVRITVDATRNEEATEVVIKLSVHSKEQLMWLVSKGHYDEVITKIQEELNKQPVLTQIVQDLTIKYEGDILDDRTLSRMTNDANNKLYELEASKSFSYYIVRNALHV